MLMIWQQMWIYVAENLPEILLAVKDHMILLVLLPVGAAAAVAVPLGVMATRWPLLERLAIPFADVIQTIPSLALLALLIPLGFGIGNKPAIFALFLYSLLPILQNTYTGIKNVDPDLKEAAVGMGMTDFQLLWKVELPLSIPVIMTGVRTATVMAVGTATLAAMVGGGGLGCYIVRGLQMMRDYMVLVGAIPSAVLALLADGFLVLVEQWVTPKGLRLLQQKSQ